MENDEFVIKYKIDSSDVKSKSQEIINLFKKISSESDKNSKKINKNVINQLSSHEKKLKGISNEKTYNSVKKIFDLINKQSSKSQENNKTSKSNKSSLFDDISFKWGDKTYVSVKKVFDLINKQQLKKEESNKKT